ncbi:hypothetical protein KL86SPO_20512 [uncultured Sporomusa sp.]|uniref:Uncharacterized protein n=1 Tax=uncultured Sporomusa sp. TaxID=307249 RepID=A0A212LP27_9FIRM|nr:hypothetical protein KL86SPO_20512 [uncultured Sporomusa sp.]
MNYDDKELPVGVALAPYLEFLVIMKHELTTAITKLPFHFTSIFVVYA